MFRENEIIVLLGAGCSADAGVPVSTQMINKLEHLLKNDNGWKDYSSLYDLVKSAILYSYGIQGLPANFDIEKLVTVLAELEKRENSILYPFVGSWIPRLMEVATFEFQTKCKSFRDKILEELKDWVTLTDYNSGSYYQHFFSFQQEFNFSLRIFSLNYDLCMEKNKPTDKDLIRGFDSKSRTWSWKPFERNEEFESSIYLYKLHGSIDWQRDNETLQLSEVDNYPKVPELIFGTNYKMQYIDPYLFYAYELRKYSLDSKIILTIGYSFRDEHINGIINQSLLRDQDRKVLVVSPDAKDLIKSINSNHERYVPVEEYAKSFLEQLTLSKITELYTTSN